jgi:phage/plasmid-like protein (TIGR03299 family)
MTDAVETMAWTGETPWHGLGEKVSNDLTPIQMLKAAHLDWKVVKRELYFQKNDGEKEKVEDKFGLIRESDESFLSVVGKTWKPVQNEVAIDFFKKFVEAGHMTMETAGSLWDGRYIWALARIGSDFSLSKTDKVHGYLLLMSPHVFGHSMAIQFTPIRVVCWNTLTYALGSKLKGDGSGFRMPHSTEFNDSVKAQAEVALGLAKEQMIEFKEASILLTKAKAKPEDVEQYFCEVLHFDPKDAVKKKNGDDKEPRMLPKFREALTFAPGQQLNTANGTWWGAVNAVTAVIDHQAGRERSTALKAAWVGGHVNLKQRAFQLALDRAA